MNKENPSYTERMNDAGRRMADRVDEAGREFAERVDVAGEALADRVDDVIHEVETTRVRLTARLRDLGAALSGLGDDLTGPASDVARAVEDFAAEARRSLSRIAERTRAREKKGLSRFLPWA